MLKGPEPSHRHFSIFHRISRNSLLSLRPHESEAGFLLPITIVASMGLLLSGLSLQTTALQSHLHFRSQVQARSDQDHLSQAAQRLVGQINLRYPCLLHLPKDDWLRQRSDCIEAKLATSLIQGGNGSAADIHTIDWQPDASGKQVLLLLELPKPPVNSGRRGLFLVRLGGNPVRAWSIQEQGLLGGQS